MSENVFMKHKTIHAKRGIHSARCTHTQTAYITQLYTYLKTYNQQIRQ